MCAKTTCSASNAGSVQHAGADPVVFPHMPLSLAFEFSTGLSWEEKGKSRDALASCPSHWPRVHHIADLRFEEWDVGATLRSSKVTRTVLVRLVLKAL